MVYRKDSICLSLPTKHFITPHTTVLESLTHLSIPLLFLEVHLSFVAECIRDRLSGCRHPRVDRHVRAHWRLTRWWGASGLYVAHILRWSLVRLRHVRTVRYIPTHSLISLPSGSFAAWSNQRGRLYTSSAGVLVRRRRRRRSVGDKQSLRLTWRIQ